MQRLEKLTVFLQKLLTVDQKTVACYDLLNFSRKLYCYLSPLLQKSLSYFILALII